MSSAAEFWRGQFVDDINHDRDRSERMSDDMRKSELDRYDKAINAIQANPQIPDDQKQLAITKIRQRGVDIMTPSLGKKRVAEMKAQFGIPEVPVQTPTDFQTPAMPASNIGPTPEMATQPVGTTQTPDGMDVPQFPVAAAQLPAKAASNYAVKPLDSNEALTMAGRAINPFSVRKQNVLDAGGTPEDATRSAQVLEGLYAPAKSYRPTDYQNFRQHKAESLGLENADQMTFEQDKERIRSGSSTLPFQNSGVSKTRLPALPTRTD
jgi:hypothetical protein